MQVGAYQEVGGVGDGIAESTGVHCILALAGGLGQPLELDPDQDERDQAEERSTPRAERQQHHIVDEEVGRLQRTRGEE